MMPAVSALSLGIACLVYPWTFFQLARIDLVTGSFIACIILLFFPLVTISAMNPLLIAMRALYREGQLTLGDSGSGLVFFISTAGSVIGVWITAFIFIPNITNFKSVLILGLTLATMSMITGLRSANIGAAKKRNLLLVSLAGLVLCGGLLGFSATYLHKDKAIVYNNFIWKIEQEYTSLFGNTKILSIDKRHKGDQTVGIWPEMPMRMYYQDGILQNLVDANGTSQDVYTYAMMALSNTSSGADASMLVLGLAAGIVPMKLVASGIDVDVVEINPVAVVAARDYFGYDPEQMNVYRMDARSYVKQCPHAYHIIIVDLFQGDGIPDYLMSRNFFRDLKNCLQPAGAAIFNTFTLPSLMPAYYHMIKTLKSEFPQLYMFHDDFTDADKTESVYLIAGNRDYQPRLNLSLRDVPVYLQDDLRRVFSRKRDIDPQLLSRATIITDEHNVFPILYVDNYLGYRKTAINTIPYQFLVN
jgi:predicted membrane-bound spermidine synthase